MKALERLLHLINLAFRTVGERNHGQLNDFVRLVIQSCRFNVDEERLFELGSGRRLNFGPWPHPALDSVMATRHQGVGHSFQLFV